MAHLLERALGIGRTSAVRSLVAFRSPTALPSRDARGGGGGGSFVNAAALAGSSFITDGGHTGSDGFVEITLVPAPGAAAVLALGGLIATRRRRTI